MLNTACGFFWVGFVSVEASAVGLHGFSLQVANVLCGVGRGLLHGCKQGPASGHCPVGELFDSLLYYIHPDVDGHHNMPSVLNKKAWQCCLVLFFWKWESKDGLFDVGCCRSL